VRTPEVVVPPDAPTTSTSCFADIVTPNPNVIRRVTLVPPPKFSFYFFLCLLGDVLSLYVDMEFSILDLPFQVSHSDVLRLPPRFEDG